MSQLTALREPPPPGAAAVSGLPRHSLTGEDVAALQQQMASLVSTAHPMARQPAEYYLGAPGKLLRSQLLIGIARAGRFSSDAFRWAAIIELIHLSSLYHDDVVDNATTRRSLPSLNNVLGPQVAVLAGDYVAARSFCDMVRLSQKGGQVLTRGLERLCQGQIEEIKLDGKADVHLDDYLAVVENKTGTLFEIACHLGALAGKLPPREVEALRLFGSRLGIVYQLIDDYRDFASSDAELGKEPGQDLVRGIVTLPLILGPDNDAVRQYVQEIASLGAKPTAEECQRLIDLVRESARLQGCREFIQDRADRCVAALEDLPYAGLKQFLTDFAGRLLVLLDPAGARR
ncbi:MAG: polyprenyl synthetase family protein [Dehalococcoidia bacterium]